MSDVPAVRPLFVTGGSGFVGRRVLAALAKTAVPDVRVLVRDPARFACTFPTPPSWTLVRGELSDPAGWAEALHGVDTVVHLASATGKVPARTYQDVIVAGTGHLISVARRAGVRRFLYASSVAAGFSDRRHYHYAEAKREAESLVMASGIETLVIRPTMVFGAGSAPFAGLARLALLPVPAVFGSGTAMVQPINVDDLAAILIMALTTTRPWPDEIITVGGPEAVTTDALLLRIRSAHGRAHRRIAHVPVEPLRTMLALLEPLLLKLLPFTAGQLSSFTNAGVVGAASTWYRELLAALPSPLMSLDSMIRVSMSHAN